MYVCRICNLTSVCLCAIKPSGELLACNLIILRAEGDVYGTRDGRLNRCVSASRSHPTGSQCSLFSNLPSYHSITHSKLTTVIILIVGHILKSTILSFNNTFKINNSDNIDRRSYIKSINIKMTQAIEIIVGHIESLTAFRCFSSGLSFKNFQK